MLRCVTHLSNSIGQLIFFCCCSCLCQKPSQLWNSMGQLWTISEFWSWTNHLICGWWEKFSSNLLVWACAHALRSLESLLKERKHLHCFSHPCPVSALLSLSWSQPQTNYTLSVCDIIGLRSQHLLHRTLLLYPWLLTHWNKKPRNH